MEDKPKISMKDKIFSKKPEQPKAEGKLSKRIRLVEQSIQEMKSNINIIKSRLGL
jgi:hypothetical protein